MRVFFIYLHDRQRLFDSKFLTQHNMAPVIIFGPTGNIGSVAARTAAERGAEVVLAMRDVNKAIPGLSKADEDAGSYKRVHADLTDASSVEEAVKTSGAKRAFAYLAFGTPDHMKSTFQAMKAGGIESVVFLSSYTVAGRALESFEASEVIPFIHAQAEISLHSVFGAEHFVAIRPGGFVTNLLRFKDGIVDGHVRLFGGHHELDCVTPGDMGRVSGTVLASGSKNGQKHVYVYGPQIISQEDGIKKIAQAVGKDVKITHLDEDEGLKMLLDSGLPKLVADYFVRQLREPKGRDIDSRFKCYKEGVDNVKLYTGKPSTSFEEWLQENKGLFAGSS